MSLSFKEFGLKLAVLRPLDEAGYAVPTPIQRLAIPHLLDGKDLIGIAQTGTGKTLAFLLPIFQSLKTGESDPQAVVICPTRELAIQVGGEAERFGKALGARVVIAYGGTSSGEQKQAILSGCDLLVATPGRLLDFVNSGWVSLRRVRFVVLDEADRMLDMGFIRDVDTILRRTPMSRQTMLFSATFPDEIRQLSQRYMFHPEIVRIDPGTRVKESVDHVFYEVSNRQKDELLLELLERARGSKVLVFTATREMTSDLARRVRSRNHEVLAISSLLSQANRERALGAFRRGEFRVLVATDVAARGIDISDIDLVVNYDVPMQAEDYVHRIGRTGRAHRTGSAVTIVTELDGRRAAQIERLLGEKVRRETLEGFAYRTAGGADRPADRGGRARRARRSGSPPASESEPPVPEAAPSGRRPRRRRRRSPAPAGSST